MKTMRTVEDKNIPSREGQVLIQVQLTQSLPFVTTTKKNKNTTTTTTTTKKKIPYPFFNTGCPQGIPRNKILDRILNALCPQGIPCKKKTTTTTTQCEKKSWFEQELKVFAIVLVSNENRDRPWAITLKTMELQKSSNESLLIRFVNSYGWSWKVPRTE